MKFLIVGQGSIGSMLGARLKKKGNDVFFVVRNPIRIPILKREGIVIFEKNGHEVIKCDGVYQFAHMEHPMDVDYVIIATKSFQAKEAAKGVKDFVPEHAGFITVQNGIMPHIEVSKTVGENRHFILSLYDSAFSFSLNQVRITGKGENILSSFSPVANLKVLEKVFRNAGFDIKVDKDAFTTLYRKLFVNVVINPITAVLKIKNGELIRNRYASEIVKGLIEDVVNVAEALNFKEKDILESLIFKTIEKTADNKSSMLQDIEWKRKTEVDDILGYTLEIAKEYGVVAPGVKNLYLMVKAIETQYLK